MPRVGADRRGRWNRAWRRPWRTKLRWILTTAGCTRTLPAVAGATSVWHLVDPSASEAPLAAEEPPAGLLYTPRGRGHDPTSGQQPRVGAGRWPGPARPQGGSSRTPSVVVLSR